jgi:hypothetical protein
MAKSEAIKLTTPLFRIGFPSVFEARSMEGDAGGTPKYGLTAIWKPADFTEKDKRLYAAIKAALDTECKRVFKKDWATCKADIEGFKTGLRNGANKELDGFGPGTVFASLSSKFSPGVVDRNKEEVSPAEGNADLVYAGAYARATVGVYAYSNKGKGVAIGLNNLQLIKYDPEVTGRLDGRGNAGDDFDDEIDSSWLEGEEDSLLGKDDLDDDIPF